jgi:hypothetical protein
MRAPSNQPQPLHARMAVLADDDVIVHGDARWPRDIDDGFCHLDIRPRWRRIAGGVVVQETVRAAVDRGATPLPSHAAPTDVHPDRARPAHTQRLTRAADGVRGPEEGGSMEELDSNCIDDLFEHQALTEQPAFVVKLCQCLNVRPHREPFDGLADDGLG